MSRGRPWLASHAWCCELLGVTGPTQELGVGPVTGITGPCVCSRPHWAAGMGPSTLASPHARQDRVQGWSSRRSHVGPGECHPAVGQSLPAEAGGI